LTVEHREESAEHREENEEDLEDEEVDMDEPSAINNYNKDRKEKNKNYLI
jgi:hypothetical protein